MFLFPNFQVACFQIFALAASNAASDVRGIARRRRSTDKIRMDGQGSRGLVDRQAIAGCDSSRCGTGGCFDGDRRRPLDRRSRIVERARPPRRPRTNAPIFRRYTRWRTDPSVHSPRRQSGCPGSGRLDRCRVRPGHRASAIQETEAAIRHRRGN